MRNALRKEVSLEGVNPHVQVQVPPSGQGHWQVPGILRYEKCNRV